MRARSLIGVLSGLAVCGAVGCQADDASEANPAVQASRAALAISLDDRYTTVTSESAVQSLRQALYLKIWPLSGSLPTSLPTATTKTVAQVGAAIPANLTNLSSNVVQLDFPTMNPTPPNNTQGGNGMAFLLTPAQRPLHRVVVLNTGHAATFDEDESASGMRNVVQTLLTENDSVLLMYMPHFTPSDDTAQQGPLYSGSHWYMFSDGPGTANPNVGDEPHDAASYRYFIEPSIIAINWLRSSSAPGGAFADIALAGLSGGGWTTTMIAALDTRPRLSIPVAGDEPGYITSEISIDPEQFIHGRLGVGYADLYVLGADGTAANGAPRRQIQVYNRHDNCCFGEGNDGNGHPEYDNHGGALPSWQASVRLTESNVRAKLFQIGSAGRYRLEIDEMADHHTVSSNTLQNILLAELDDDRKLVGVAGNDQPMFYRGLNGRLWRRTWPGGGGSVETDTGVTVAGVPTAVEGGPNAVDVFARDSMAGSGANNLVHAFLPQGQSTWSQEQLSGVSITDPVAVAAGGAYDVVMLGTNGTLFRRSSQASTYEQISTNVFAGPPSPIYFNGALHVFTRGKDLNVYHTYRSGSTWTDQKLSAALSGFPSAATCGSLMCVAGLGTDGNVYISTVSATGSWSGWTGLSAGSFNFHGSPSLAAVGAGLVMHVATKPGTVGRFFEASTPGGAWTYTDLGGTTFGSPTTVQGTGDALASGGQTGVLWFHSGAMQALGGLFD